MDAPLLLAEVGWFQGPCGPAIVSLHSFRLNRGPDICPLTSEVTTQYAFRILGGRSTTFLRLLLAKFLEVWEASVRGHVPGPHGRLLPAHCWSCLGVPVGLAGAC